MDVSEACEKEKPLSDLPLNEVHTLQGWALAPEEREGLEYDVVIVGAGPAGRSVAIRLTQIVQEAGSDSAV